MIIRYAEEKNFIELRQFYDGMCKVLSEKDFLPEGDKGGFPPDEMIKDAIKERNEEKAIEAIQKHLIQGKIDFSRMDYMV